MRGHLLKAPPVHPWIFSIINFRIVFVILVNINIFGHWYFLTVLVFFNCHLVHVFSMDIENFARFNIFSSKKMFIIKMFLIIYFADDTA